MRYKILILVGLLLLASSLVLSACGQNTTETLPPPTLSPLNTPAQEPQQTPVTCPEPEPCPEPEAVDVPFHEVWAASGHADAEAEAFAHWNEADPPGVPANCAKCHSTEGYIDFVGADGSEFGVVNNPPQVGSVISCNACHNEATLQMTSVVFPSGIELTGLGEEARCMQCHQGRASKVQVDEAIEAAGLTGEDDTVSAELPFVNIHYYAAAATQYGTQAKGGYEYDGMAYNGRFNHVEGYTRCVDCHEPHSLEIRFEECAACHTGVTDAESVRNIRMAGSLSDYDGDGNVDEGLVDEITGLQEMLLQALQAYSSEVVGTGLVYNSAAYPYFFIDTNGNGQLDEGEGIYPNRFASWTPRLLKAAYNYQTSLKDPGAFAHGGKYIIQILHDSIADLNGSLGEPIDLSAAQREDPGHFEATAAAFRYWDNTGVVPSTCAKCHSAHGLPQFLREASLVTDQVSGIVTSNRPSDGLQCATCHDDVATFTRYQVNAVKFPSGAILSFGEGNDNNLCINCHQGREANATVQAAIARTKAQGDTVAEGLTFRNPHYFAAGATLFGSEAAGAFQYPDKEYNGRFLHVPAMSTCVQCHDAHALQVNTLACSGCHQGANTLEALRTIRTTEAVDYDGDGNATEGIGEEIDTMYELLFEAIQEYANTTEGTSAIVYDAHSHPYWFLDTNGNGVTDPDEVNRGNQYNTWTPRLLGAAYNYQWVSKDPGAFAHNGMYILQVLYDSLEDIGADVSGMTRPAVEATTP